MATSQKGIGILGWILITLGGLLGLGVLVSVALLVVQSAQPAEFADFVSHDGFVTVHAPGNWVRGPLEEDVCILLQTPLDDTAVAVSAEDLDGAEHRISLEDLARGVASKFPKHGAIVPGTVLGQPGYRIPFEGEFDGAEMKGVLGVTWGREKFYIVSAGSARMLYSSREALLGQVLEGGSIYDAE